MNYRMDIQYDGTRYGGWQKQKDTDNTIQGKIEDVLSKMCGKQVSVQGAGRTEPGVHAKGQVANALFETEKTCEEICAYLNYYLPEDIEIVRVTEAQERFHSRLNAREKVYCYRIAAGIHKNVFERKYQCPLHENLDVNAMRKAAKTWKEPMILRCFCSNKKMKKSSVRTVYNIEIQELSQEIILTFTGNGFLYNMVRILVGILN